MLVDSRKKIMPLGKLRIELGKLRGKGVKIVSTNGCFDLLHAGHVRVLEAAKSLGDVLVVGVNSDASVRKLKGPKRPINKARSRAEVVAGLGCVDFVCIFPETTPVKFIKAVLPQIHVKGGEYEVGKMPESKTVREGGGRIVLVKMVPGHSTTKVIGRIRHQTGAAAGSERK